MVFSNAMVVTIRMFYVMRYEDMSHYVLLCHEDMGHEEEYPKQQRYTAKIFTKVLNLVLSIFIYFCPSLGFLKKSASTMNH